jgi:hypothetical protein
LGKVLRIVKKVFPHSRLTETELANLVQRAGREFTIGIGRTVISNTEREIERRRTKSGQQELRGKFEERQYGALEDEVERRGGTIGAGAAPKSPYRNFDDFESSTEPDEKPIELSLAYAILMLGWGRSQPGMQGVTELHVDDERTDVRYTVSEEGISSESLSGLDDNPDDPFIVRFNS